MRQSLGVLFCILIFLQCDTSLCGFKVGNFLQHQMNFPEFIKENKDIGYQKDCRRSDIPGQQRSKVIKCQSCKICELSIYLT